MRQIALEKIVDEGPDRRNGEQLPDVLPARGEGGLHDVRGELERQPGDQPACEADVAFMKIAPPGDGLNIARTL